MLQKVFYDTKRTFICMTLWAGGNVLDRTLEMGFAEEDAVIVVQDVLDALDHIHSRGLIHCAVEPANIYLVSGDRSDFWRLQPRSAGRPATCQNAGAQRGA